MTTVCWRAHLAVRIAILLGALVYAPAALVADTDINPARPARPARPDKHDEHEVYKQANAAYRAGKHEEAIALLDKALEQSAERPRLSQLRRRVLLDMLKRRARLLRDEHDYQGEHETWQAFLAAGPSGADARKVREILRYLHAVETTHLEILVTNGPADIYFLPAEIRRERKKRTPVCTTSERCKRGVLPRAYRVCAERPGFEPACAEVTAEKGRITAHTLTLVELPSALTLEVVPEDAHVLLDGEPMSERAGVLLAGTHRLRIFRPGFVTQELTLEARQGAPVSIRAVLDERIPVRVTAASRPPAEAGKAGDALGAALLAQAPPASLLLDDRPITAERGTIRVPHDQAPHRLVAKLPGHEDAVVEIPGDRTPEYAIDIQMQPLPPPPPPVEPRAPSTLRRVVLISAGASALTSYGVAALYAVRSKSAWRRALTESCQRGEDSVLWCDEEGLALAGDARRLVATSEIAAAIGVGASVGVMWALHLDEEAEAGGRMSRSRKLSVGAAAALAAAGLGIGVTYGLKMREAQGELETPCSTDCGERNYALDTRAGAYTRSAVLGAAVGGVAAAGALTMWLTAPGRRGRAAPGEIRVAPDIGAERVGLTITGGF